MSDFFVRKLRTFFKHADLDDDGYISLKDIVEMGERHCNAEKADAIQRENVRACFANVWRCWMKSTESDDNGLLTPFIMVESMKQQRTDPEFRKAYRGMCEAFFHVLDVNGDGFLQEDEYARSIAQIGYKDTNVVRRAFDAIDLNKDGKLSIDEFTTALFEYITSDDEKSPYNGIWGPLVD